MIKIFFQLLQVAIGNSEKLTLHSTGSGQVCPSEKEWALLYAMCKKQSLVGIGFAGISRLPTEQRPPLRQLAQWIHDAEKIKERNLLLNSQCKEVSEQLAKDGFDSMILKGQGNIINYPEWLKDGRNPGDIDILMVPKEKTANPVKHCVEYLLGIEGCKHVSYLHAEREIEKGTEIEYHFRPSYFNEPFANHRLQNYYKENVDKAIFHTELGFNVPSPEFNVIFQITHIYKHLTDEGIGLRQLLDYYFVLKNLPASMHKGEIMNTISSLGMKRFASAVMYVLKTVFAMPDQYQLCTPNEKAGKFLLSEILMAGNFGQYDKRLTHYSYTAGNTKGQIIREIQRCKRSLHFVRSYPSEVIWEPYNRLMRLSWRKFKLWRY